MSKLKKLASALLALVMAFGLTCTAFAADTYTITITSEKSGHTYEAYQVFTGDLDATGTVLSNVVWGSGVEGDDLLDELKKDTTVVDKDADDNDITVASLFTSCTTAADVAKVLSDNNSNTALADAFAQIASENLSTMVAGTSTETATAGTYTITGLTAGYYLVKNKDKSVKDEGDAYTDIILKVVSNVTVAEKATYPTLDKQIVLSEDDPDTADKNEKETAETNTASIGDTVTFELTSTVPDMSAYTKYYFIVNDTLSKGLAYTAGSMTITVGSNTLECASINGVAQTTTGNYLYDLTTSTNATTGETEITIVFKNFIQYTKGDAITITYNAVVDDDAVIGTAGNDNTASLTYSNNPNVTDNGDPDNPDKPDPNNPTPPTGETPDEKTTTYVTGIKVLKVDEDGNALTGAGFTLTGDAVNKVKVTTDTYNEDTAGDYWMLTDGTYTTTAPTIGGDDDNSASYANTETKYSKTTTTTWNTTTVKVSATATVGSDGVLVFEGLGEGTYTLEETTVPDGYNKAENVEITITCNEENINAGEACTWTVTSPGVISTDGSIVEVTVANHKGSTLPSTGGIGTTIFYVVGGVLVVGAVVLLITKKRMSE